MKKKKPKPEPETGPDYTPDIVKLIDEIRDTLIAVGIKQTGIAFKKAKIEKAKHSVAKECYLWLVGFQASSCKEYLRVKALVPAGVWALYKAGSVKGSYEQNQMRLIRDQIRKQWSERPEILRRTKKVVKNVEAK